MYNCTTSCFDSERLNIRRQGLIGSLVQTSPISPSDRGQVGQASNERTRHETDHQRLNRPIPAVLMTPEPVTGPTADPSAPMPTTGTVRFARGPVFRAMATIAGLKGPNAKPTTNVTGTISEGSLPATEEPVLRPT